MNKPRVGTSNQMAYSDYVLAHHARLPAWPRNTLHNLPFGPVLVTSGKSGSMTIKGNPNLGHGVRPLPHSVADEMAKRGGLCPRVCRLKWQRGDRGHKRQGGVAKRWESRVKRPQIS